MKRVTERVGEIEPHPTLMLIEEMMQAQRREWRLRVGLLLGSLSAGLVILALAVVAHLAD